jgi:isoleucyl-tRNA synthetase
MPFDPVASTYDPVALEERVLAQWRDGKVFERSLEQRDGAPEWVFYEGPPTANGRPGIHHVLARTFKDLYCRYHTMRGRYVARKGGWDCHGLPVELEVEKELGFSGKAQIDDYGIEAFNERCRDSVHRYVEDWSSLTGRMGMWLDVKDAYWTLTNDYIESVWWLLRQMWDKDLLYEGFKVVPYCGRCGTALSSHELGQPGAYQDVTEPSIYVRFPVAGQDFDLLVWTTTPWTLISNVAAAVGPAIDYVRVRVPGHDRQLVLAAGRVASVLGDDVEVLGPIAASDLVGLHYERPFTFLPVDASASRVVAADFVTIDDGSGIVHLAPAFGEVDREVGIADSLPLLNPVDANARFMETVPPYKGLRVKDADPRIIEDLDAAGRLVKIEDYTHSYPHCWRCGTALIYWAKTSWFIRTSAHKDALLRENERIGWHPEGIKHGRFGDWLENNIDWALSRDRYWGTPLPIWRCDAPEPHDTCVGSIAQLSEHTGRDLAGLDLHRPYVDDVTFTCPSEGCTSRARRVEPVLDAWFDSGAMPSAQFHYPFENEELFARRFPADFICEAIDQTRGWFYSLLAINTLVFGQTPYRNVVCLALVVDRDGRRMSKSRGNIVNPWEFFSTRGADALRWYFVSAGSPWTNFRISPEAVDEGLRQFLLTLWNTYGFFVTYANIDGWTQSPAPPPITHVLDRWIRSRLHGTVQTVTSALDEFDALAAAHALESFLDDLSNWYVRRSRSRFWKAADPAAHATLHECLTTVSLLLAPFCPFVSDAIYGNLTTPRGSELESVHLADWPAADATAIDPDLETNMELARRFVTLGRAARSDAKMKVRQPLRRALVLAGRAERLPDDVATQVADELNVKSLEFVGSLEGLIRYSVVPNFRALGPRLGPRLPAVKAALDGADGAAVQAALDRDGKYVVEVDGAAVELLADDVEVRAHEHEEFALAQDGPVAVALDLALDDDLRAEGVARELVRAVNDHRKATGLAIADRIRVTLHVPAALIAAVRRHADWIATEVLAVELTVTDEAPGGLATLDVDGTPVGIAIERA